jgi:hypothetical protein
MTERKRDIIAKINRDLMDALVRLIKTESRVEELENALREIMRTAPFGKPQEIARAALGEKKE